MRLASEGGFAGAVLDAGRGTGENALHIASPGLSVLGALTWYSLTDAEAREDVREQIVGRAPAGNLLERRSRLL